MKELKNSSMKFLSTFNLCIFAYTSVFALGLSVLTPNYSRSSQKKSDVFTASRPLDLFAHEYQNFELLSQTDLTIVQNEKTKNSKGENILKLDESGQFYLRRKILSQNNPVEIVHLTHQTFYKDFVKKNFQPVLPNDEFVRLAENTVSEIFSLFKQAELDTTLGGQSSSQNKLHCFSNANGSLCFDPKTDLPLSGELNLSVSSSSTLHLSFKVTPSSKEKLQIVKP